MHSTKEEGKAAFMKSWLGDRGAEIIDCYDWTDEEWGDHKLLFTRLKEKIKPTSRNMIQSMNDTDVFKNQIKHSHNFWHTQK